MPTSDDDDVPGVDDATAAPTPITPSETTADPTVAAEPAPDASQPSALTDADVTAMIRNNAVNNVGNSPDKEAGYQHLARFTGQPLADVKADPMPAQQAAASMQVQADDLVNNHSAAAKFLAQPNNMAIAMDDIANIKDLSTVSQGGSTNPLLAGAQSGFEDVWAGMKRLDATLGRYMPGMSALDDAARSVGLNVPQPNEEIAQAQDLAEKASLTAPQGGLAGVEGAVGGMVPYIAAETLGKPASIGVMANTGYSDTREQLREMGIDDKTANVISLLSGAAQGSMGAVPVLGDMGDKYGVKPFIQSLLSGAAKLGLFQAAQSSVTHTIGSTVLANQGYEQQAADFAPTYSDIANQLAAGAAFHIGSTGMHMLVDPNADITGTVLKHLDQVNQARQAQAQAAALSQINALSAASKVRTRRVDQFQTFMEDATADGPVENLYFDPGALAQSGVNMDNLAANSPTIAAQLPAAMASGSDIKVPTSEFAAHLAGTDEGVALLQHAKTDPEGMSKVEADEFMQTQGPALQKMVEDIIDRTNSKDITKIIDPDVQADIQKQIEATGYRTGDQAAVEAQRRAAFNSIMAQRVGMTPMDYYNQFGKGAFLSDVNDPNSLAQSEPGENGLAGFHSKMQQVLDQKLNGKGTAQQYLDQIKSFAQQGHFKKDELYWSGLEDHLQNIAGDEATKDTPLTKSQIMQAISHVQINDKISHVQINDKINGGEGGDAESDIPTLDDIHFGREEQDNVSSDFVESEVDYYAEMHKEDNEPEAWFNDGNAGDLVDTDEDDEGVHMNHKWNDQKIREYVYDQAESSAQEMQSYHQHVTAGDHNYTIEYDNPDMGNEWRVYSSDDGDYVATGNSRGGDTLSEAHQALYEHLIENGYARHDDEDNEGGTQWAQYQTPGEKTDYKELYLTAPEIDDHGVSHHAGAPEGTIAHARFSTRIDADGKKNLYIDEIQSDWHQQGREKGYRGDNMPDTKMWLASKVRDGRYLIYDDGEGEGEDVGAVDANSPAEAIQKMALQKSGKIAKAPFADVNKYTELMVKRLILHAIETGADRVSWSPGHVQAERWSGLLQTHVDSIGVRSDKEGEQLLSVHTPRGQNVTDKIAEQAGAKLENGYARLTDEQVASIFGASLGDTIKQRASTYRDRMAAAPVTNAEPEVLQGVDLKINDKGMTEYYDKIIRNVASGIVKKFGGKIEQTTIDAAHMGKLPVQTFNINDAMRQSLNEHGFPLFQDNKLASFNPRTLATSLLNGSNLSSLIHEDGHYFLEMLSRHVANFGDDAASAKDMDTLMRWFKIDGTTPQARLDNWRSMSLDEQRPHHEQMAESFERYMFSGKAPSLELQPAFQRMKQWMLATYKSVKDYVTAHPAADKLSPEVRQVFDRMLASEQQITEMQNVREMLPMFKDVEQSGMTPEEFANYHMLGVQATQDATNTLEARSLRDMKWLSGAKSRELSRLQSDAAVKRAAIRREVTDDVMVLPVNRARTFFRRGEVDGEKVDGPHRIDIDQLQIKQGDKEDADWKQLESKYGKFGLFGKDGIDPNVAAEMFGYRDSAALVDALLNEPSARESIAAGTDQRMLERHGDLTDPQSLSDAADRAIHNEARGKFIASEASALSKAVGSGKILYPAVKQFAEQIVGRLKVRDLNPNRFAQGEVRAARRAEQARAKSDIAEAATQKRNQLIQNRATKAAYDAQEAVEKGLSYLKKFSRQSTRKAVGPDYIAQIDALLGRFDLSKSTTLKEADRRSSLKDWYDAQVAAGYAPNIDPRLINEAQSVSYRDMSVDSFKGLVDSVKSIETLGRLKQRLLSLKDAREFKAVINEAKDQLATLPQRTAEDMRNPGKGGRGQDKVDSIFFNAKSGLRAFDATLTKIESLCDQLDGGNPLGIFNRMIYRRVSEGTAEKARLSDIVVPKLKAAMESMPDDERERLLDKHTLPDLTDFKTGKPTQILHRDLLMMGCHCANDDNFQRMLDGENVNLEKRKMQPWTREAVIDALNTHMSKADIDWINHTVHAVDLWPEYVAQFKRLGGELPPHVEGNPLQLKNGIIEGGYFPIIHDPARSTRAEDNAQERAAKMFEGNATRPSTDKGRTMARVEGASVPFLLSIDALPHAMDAAIHDLAYREPVIDVLRFISHGAITDGMDNTLGPEYRKQFKPWLKDIASGSSVDNASLSRWDRAARWTRTSATVVGIGYRLSTMLTHGPTAYSHSVEVAGVDAMRKGMGAFYGTPEKMKQAWSFVTSRSPFMAGRMETYDRDIKTIFQQMQTDAETGPLSKAAKIYDGAIRFSTYGVAISDMMSTAPMWLGVYNEALTDHSEDDAIFMADKAVRQAHGGGGIEDASAIQRGSEAWKLATIFYSFHSHVYQRQRILAQQAASGVANLRAGNLSGAKEDFALVLAKTFWLSLFPTLIYTATHRRKDEGVAAQYSDELVTSQFAGIPVARDVANAMSFGKDYSTPAGQVLNAFAKVGSDAFKTVHGEPPTGKKALGDTGQALKYLTRLPVDQAMMSGKFLWDVYDGQQDPQDVADWWNGILHGKF